MNIIVGYTDLLLEGAFPSEGEQLDALSRIHQQSRQLLDLIQSMLDLNRMEAGGISLVCEEFPIAAALDSLRNGLPTAWCRPGVALRWEAQDTADPMHSDRGKVELILRNLLHNALKYTSHGSVTVRALPDRHRGRVDFSVIDTGDGIAPEDLAGIFDMFRQGTTGPPRGGGVGLGLYLVKRLTDALGGTIAVDSRPGAGSSFTVAAAGRSALRSLCVAAAVAAWRPSVPVTGGWRHAAPCGRTATQSCRGAALIGPTGTRLARRTRRALRPSRAAFACFVVIGVHLWMALC